jgi:hypothetical protein
LSSCHHGATIEKSDLVLYLYACTYSYPYFVGTSAASRPSSTTGNMSGTPFREAHIVSFHGGIWERPSGNMSRAVKGTPQREVNEVPFSRRDQKNVIRTSGGCGCTCDSDGKRSGLCGNQPIRTYDDRTIPNPSSCRPSPMAKGWGHEP